MSAYFVSEVLAVSALDKRPTLQLIDQATRSAPSLMELSGFALEVSSGSKVGVYGGCYKSQLARAC